MKCNSFVSAAFLVKKVLLFQNVFPHHYFVLHQKSCVKTVEKRATIYRTIAANRKALDLSAREIIAIECYVNPKVKAGNSSSLLFKIITKIFTTPKY